MPKYDFKQYFPFPRMRSQQAQAIEFALDAFEAGKKYVILEMGTGCGKSATGVCISRYLQCHTSSQPNKNLGSWFLTTQKILQEQYLRDFGGPGPLKMKSIKSSTSYTCQMHEDDESDEKISCGEVTRLIRANNIFKMIYQSCQCKCKYQEDKSKFLEALEGVTNYSYFFAETQYAKQPQTRERDLLVLDEAHTVEEQLGSFVEVSVSEWFITSHLGLKVPKRFNDQTALVKWIRTRYIKELTVEVQRMGKLLEDMSDAKKKVKTFQDYAKKHDALDKHMCKINRFLKVYDDKNWILNEEPLQGRKLRRWTFKPVDISDFASDHLFNFANHVLMMSATILDKDVFCKSLGLDPINVAFMRIESPFAVDNRPIHIMPVGSMSRRAIESTLPKMVEAVKFILDQHKEEKGIIHCVNYRIANHLLENVDDHRLVTHDAKNRDQILKMHEESDQPTVLVSPSMMEGVDLSGDKSRFQILCKIPFPFLGDEVVKKRMEKNPAWYNYKTVMMVVQAFGRSVRNERDHAVSYVLDSDWERFYRNSRKMFPGEFLKAIR